MSKKKKKSKKRIRLTPLEEPIRLSESMVWELQRRYYDRQSTKAWTEGEVPSWITSNPFIARAYARLLMAWLEDCREQGGARAIDPDVPVLVVELGSGSGQHGWHLAQELAELARADGRERSPFQVVLTDFTESNLKAWESNPVWRPLLDSGAVDFAKFDADHPGELVLRSSGQVLRKEGLQNPIALVANYFFDTICHDAFRVRKGKLFETRVSLTYKGKGNPDPEDPKLFQRMKFKLTQEEITGPYYENPEWDEILHRYRDAFEKADILMPTAGLRCLEAFAGIAADKGLLLISGDKHYRNEKELEEGVGVHLTPHGSFSMMVNADALGKRLETLGGFSLHTRNGDTTFTNAALVLPPAGSRQDSPRTRRAFEDAFCDFSPADYVNVFLDIGDSLYDPTLNTLLSHLRLSHWDSEVFKELSDHFDGLLADAFDETKEDLREALIQIWAHHFPLDTGDDVAFLIGSLLYQLDDYEQAYTLYSWSLTHAGPNAAVHYNLGLCCDGLGKSEEALSHHEAALGIDPDYKRAKKEIKRLRAERTRSPAPL